MKTFFEKYWGWVVLFVLLITAWVIEFAPYTQTDFKFTAYDYSEKYSNRSKFDYKLEFEISLENKIDSIIVEKFRLESGCVTGTIEEDASFEYSGNKLVPYITSHNHNISTDKYSIELIYKIDSDLYSSFENAKCEGGTDILMYVNIHSENKVQQKILRQDQRLASFVQK